MTEIIKKIFSLLGAMPAFTNVFKKASQTGKVDPVDMFNALSSISGDTKKCASAAASVIQNGGSIKDGVNAIKNIGTIEAFGNKINMQTLTEDLRKYGSSKGGIIEKCYHGIANLADNISNESEENIINLGNAACDVDNLNDLIKNMAK